MNKFKRTKGYYRGAFVPGTIGGGFSDGGAVGKNTQPNYGGFVGGMTRGFDDGGQVPNANQQALLDLAGNQPQLSPNDFTQPGENIPQNAGISDFIKYNLAHTDPNKLAMQMGTIGGGIKSAADLPNPPASLLKSFRDLPDAPLELLQGEKTPVVESDPEAETQADKTDRGPIIEVQPKTSPSMGVEKSLENYKKSSMENAGKESSVPNRNSWLNDQDKAALFDAMMKNRSSR